MRRRTLLTLGAGSAALLALGGASVLLLRPASAPGRLSTDAADVFAAVTPAVLGTHLPGVPALRAAALQAQLTRLQHTINGLPPAMQAEVDQLLAVLASAPGRLLLAGLTRTWREASVEQVSASLQGMRQSPLALRQQAFHALRDLSNAAWFADAASWPALGYPGPRAIVL